MRTQWLYSSNVNGKISGYVHGGTALATTSLGNNWYKIVAGPYVGKYVWAPSSTPTEKPIATNVTRYAGVNDIATFYATPSTSSPTSYSASPTEAITGDLYASGWFQSSGRLSGWWQKSTMSTNPFNTIETHQWQDTTGFKAMAPTNVTVTRYAVANNGSTIRTHSAPDYTNASFISTIPSGTSLSGHYVNSHWFSITSGKYSGRYISSAMIWTTADQSTVNGKLTDADLCTLPDSMRLDYDSHDQYMGCESVSQLTALSAAEKSVYGYGVRQWDSYRDYATQVYYYVRYGAKQAAYPGKSNHGLGNAFDMRYIVSDNGGILKFTSPEVVNFTKLGSNFGWTKPAYLYPGGAKGNTPEPWHFEMFG